MVCGMLCCVSGVGRVWHMDKEVPRSGRSGGGSFVCVLLCLFNMFLRFVLFLFECVITDKNILNVFLFVSCFRD